jgi:hypothetical protein
MLAPLAYSQTGTFVGTVARDSVGTAVGQAQIQIPQLSLSTTTNYQGEFRFGNVPPGRYAVTVRAVGFQPFNDSISVKAGATVDGDIILTALPVSLETVHTTAANTAPKHFISSELNDFEERRKRHLGGNFLADSELSTTTNHSLARLLQSKFSNISPLGDYIRAGRDHVKGNPLIPGSPPCIPRLYIDGTLTFDPASKGATPPDLAHEDPSLYSGVEFYSDGASMPARFNSTNSGCGVLLLWSREHTRTP